MTIPDSVVEAALNAERIASGYTNPIESYRAGWPRSYAEDMAAMRAALEAAAPLMAAQWIPCSERMPCIGERVLVWGPNWTEWPIAPWNGEGWFGRVGDHHRDDVSHWQPIPQPPKETT